MFFSKKDNSLKNYFVCDLGSSSVAGAVVSIGKENKAEVLWQSRRNLNVLNKEHRSDLKILEKELKDLVQSADNFLFRENKNPIPIQKVFISISSPWYISRLRKEEIKKSKPFVFSETDYANLINRARESLCAEILKERSLQSQIFTSGSVIVDQKKVSLKINGYTVEDPINTQVRDLKLSLMLSVIPKELNEYIHAVFDGFWSNVGLDISTFPYTHFNALRYLNLHNDRTALIDVSGIETEVTYLEDSEISKMAYVDMGKNSFTHAIVKSLNLEDFMAESELKLYLQKLSTNKQATDMHFLLDPVEKEWKNKMAELILTDHSWSSRKYILTVDPGYFNYFKKMLSEVFEELLPGIDMNISRSEYIDSDIDYANSITKDIYLEILIFSILNSR